MQKVRKIGSGLSRINRQVNNHLENLLKPLGICRTDFAYLFFVEANPGSTQEAIREYVAVDKAIVTRILRRMEIRGLVKRKKCTSDKRAMNVFLTTKSLQLLPKLHKLLDQFDSLLVKGFTDQEIDVLIPFLHRILINLQGEIYEHTKTDSGKH